MKDIYSITTGQAESGEKKLSLTKTATIINFPGPPFLLKASGSICQGYNRTGIYL